MTSLTENGWNRNNQEKEEMNDAEIKALFDMIDKDKSGSLTMRVNYQGLFFRTLVHNFAGSKESCQTYKGQIWDRRREPKIYFSRAWFD